MAKSTRNSGKRWSSADEAKLRQLGEALTRVAGLKLGRSWERRARQGVETRREPQAGEPVAVQPEEVAVASFRFDDDSSSRS